MRTMRERFRLWLIETLKALLLWLDPPTLIVVAPDLVHLRTRELVAAAEGLDASGEYKRHQVYAALLKEFPSALKRDLAFAIECVRQER